MMNNLFQALAEAARTRQPVALGIINGVKGSSPQKLGAKALFYPDRKIQGTLGGGCLEAEAQRLALQSLRDGKPQTFELVLDHDFGWDDGLICGGKVSGLIIPNAQSAGADFWNDLAIRDVTKSWGVKSDFTLARLEPAIAPRPSLLARFPIGSTPKPSPHPAPCGSPAPATSPKPSRHSRCNSISPSAFSTTALSLRTTTFSLAKFPFTLVLGRNPAH
jgi:xanthine/CO dehydrogenase XdhC/CoxF family maturation factor